MSQFPQAFIENMRAQLGDEYEAFIHAIDGPVTTSVRLNPAKANTSEIDFPLLSGNKVKWTDQGYYLSERPSFTFDPLFHAGAYYVQESSSMFLEQAFKATGFIDEPIRVLDLCAAPGGKSTHLLSLTNKDSLLVSNELIAGRNHILRQNLARWGKANVIVTQNKAADFVRIGEYFDVIVIDAPCSGEGLFRKDKNAIAEWSESNVAMCAERQRDILANMVQCLKPNGYLIYSTCTYEPAENIDNIKLLISEYGLECVPIGGTDSFQPELTTVSSGSASGYAFYPHRTKGEGFFISLLQKKSDRTIHPSQVYKIISDKAGDELRPHLSNFVSDADKYTVLKHQQYYNILPQIFVQDYKRLSQSLYVRNAGISAGEIKGKDFIPAHELSLCVGLRKDFPAIDLDHKTAISYLRAETISVSIGHKGWMVARYKGAALGFIKALPNRINNYFPKEWRILKAQA